MDFCGRNALATIKALAMVTNNQCAHPKQVKNTISAGDDGSVVCQPYTESDARRTVVRDISILPRYDTSFFPSASATSVNAPPHAAIKKASSAISSIISIGQPISYTSMNHTSPEVPNEYIDLEPDNAAMALNISAFLPYTLGSHTSTLAVAGSSDVTWCSGFSDCTSLETCENLCVNSGWWNGVGTYKPSRERNRFTARDHMSGHGTTQGSVWSAREYVGVGKDFFVSLLVRFHPTALSRRADPRPTWSSCSCAVGCVCSASTATGRARIATPRLSVLVASVSWSAHQPRKAFTPVFSWTGAPRTRSR